MQHVAGAFKALRAVILTASACQKPDLQKVLSVLEPISKEVTAVVSVPDTNRKERVWHQHFQFIAEGIPSIGWVGIVSQIVLWSYGGCTNPLVGI